MVKKTVNCPYCGMLLFVDVPRGWELRNTHEWDGDPGGSVWGSTEEIVRRCTNPKCRQYFHVEVKESE